MNNLKSIAPPSILVIVAAFLFLCAGIQAQVDPAATAISAEGVDVTPPVPGETFEQTAPPPLTYEPNPETEAKEPAPRDEKLEEVAVELDRMERASADESAPEAPRSATGWSNYWRVFMWLLVMVAFIILLGWLMRKFGGRTPILAGARLGAVLGRIYLAPRASLFFVRTGGRVLVVGVTQHDIALVSEFDADAFDSVAAAEAPAQAERVSSEADRKAMESGKRFLSQLKASTRAMHQEPAEARRDDRAEAPSVDLEALRQDILRLQEHLKEELREE
jgi:flagellar biogenesis protein FliO